MIYHRFFRSFEWFASGFFFTMIPDAFCFLKIKPKHRDRFLRCILDAFFTILWIFLHRDCYTIFIPMLGT